MGFHRLMFFVAGNERNKHRRINNVFDIKNIEYKLNNRELKAIGKHKYFSVVVPLVETEDGLSMIFEQRSSSLRTQPGDICFPGGNIEEGETPLECALREMDEEVGIGGSDVKVLGQFDTMYGFSGYTLHTFVASVSNEAMAKMRVNDAEVAEVFTVPVQYFVDTPVKHYDMDVVSQTKDFPYEETGISPDYNWRVGKNVIPLYKYNDKVIWGVTARIVEWIVKEIFV